MMGTITLPAIDLPTSPGNKTNFRLWGLTMGMTRDIIEFTDLNHNHLAFLELTRRKPIYSRPDIGWIALLITNSILYWRRLSSNKSAIVMNTR
jgi:hypothetical protein